MHAKVRSLWNPSAFENTRGAIQTPVSSGGVHSSSGCLSLLLRYKVRVQGKCKFIDCGRSNYLPCQEQWPLCSRTFRHWRIDIQGCWVTVQVASNSDSGCMNSRSKVLKWNGVGNGVALGSHRDLPHPWTQDSPVWKENHHGLHYSRAYHSNSNYRADLLGTKLGWSPSILLVSIFLHPFSMLGYFNRREEDPICPARLGILAVIIDRHTLDAKMFSFLENIIMETTYTAFSPSTQGKPNPKSE